MVGSERSKNARAGLLTSRCLTYSKLACELSVHSNVLSVSLRHVHTVSSILAWLGKNLQYRESKPRKEHAASGSRPSGGDNRIQEWQARLTEVAFEVELQASSIQMVSSSSDAVEELLGLRRASVYQRHEWRGVVHARKVSKDGAHPFLKGG